MAYWDTVWSFETPKFRVLAEVTDCADDPRDSFQFDEDIKAVFSRGRVKHYLYRYLKHCYGMAM